MCWVIDVKNAIMAAWIAGSTAGAGGWKGSKCGGGSRFSGSDMGDSLEEDKGLGFWGWDDEAVVIGWEAKDLALLRVGRGCMKWGDVEET